MRIHVLKIWRDLWKLSFGTITMITLNVVLVFHWASTELSQMCVYSRSIICQNTVNYWAIGQVEQCIVAHLQSWLLSWFWLRYIVLHIVSNECVQKVYFAVWEDHFKKPSTCPPHVLTVLRSLLWGSTVSPWLSGTFLSGNLVIRTEFSGMEYLLWEIPLFFWFVFRNSIFWTKPLISYINSLVYPEIRKQDFLIFWISSCQL